MEKLNERKQTKRIQGRRRKKRGVRKNIIFKITSGYRDYNFQSALYNNYVNTDGKELADTYSARPGYSEHQLGYSVDSN